MSWALFPFGLASALLALNAWRPPRSPGPVAVLAFFPGWLTTELAMHMVLAQALGAGALVYVAGLTDWSAYAGLALVGASSVSLVLLQARSGRTRAAFTRALEAGLGQTHGTQIAKEATPWVGARLGLWPLFSPFLGRRRGVAVQRNLCFWKEGRHRLTLDVHAPLARPTRAPILVYVHGGGWIVGYRRYQGLPLMTHLARLGWVCFSVDYRLSPVATFPDHLVDVKRALAWVREHAAEYGADPDFIVVAGNSAGAHLAALAALTANEPELQPGFEGLDTKVSGCVGFYGVYDFEDRHKHWPHPGFGRFIERVVLKAQRSQRPELFTQASPIARVHPAAPPFLLVHGDRDTLAPTDESRRFAAALRGKSGAAVAYVEVEGAQHAFEIFPSARAAHTVEGTTRFLAWLYSRHIELLAGAPAEPPSEPGPSEPGPSRAA